ncbi:hypothetical protein [Archaeoglobus sp. UBA231]|nr:hypothetical protein [Archaeoglobus sp. UBA231]
MVGVLLALVVLGSMGTAMAATNATVAAEMHYKRVKIVKFDPVLENVTPYWIIIAAGASEEGKKAVFEYIDSSKNLAEKEKLKLKKSIISLWKKYGVVKVKKGDITLITLKSGAKPMKEGENAILEKIAKAANEYFKERYVENGNVEVKWFTDVHQDMIYIACQKWDVPNNLCNIARDHADDPDFWYQVPPPPGYPDWMWKFIMQVVHSWTHYYNPERDWGSAPDEFEKYTNIAKNYYSSAKYNLAFENLGYASHFLADVGQPLHTGAEARQVALSLLLLRAPEYIHYAYEGYVSSNWYSGYNFRSYVYGVPVHHYVPITDPEQAVKNLAGYTHQYADTIVWAIFTNPDGWQNNQNIRNLTQNCIMETTRYLLGLVDYVVQK